MKTLTRLGVLFLIFAGCTNIEYQKLQRERDSLIANYENLRREYDGGTVAAELTDKLLGKWKFLGLELAENNVGETVAEARAALYAYELEALTLEFFEERNAYYYRGKRDTTTLFGRFNLMTARYGDNPFPFIRFIRRSGRSLEQLLFAAVADGSPFQQKNAMTFSVSKAPDIGISVTDDRLYFTFYGRMTSSPNGWVQSGGLRCYFERIVSEEEPRVAYQERRHRRAKAREIYEDARRAAYHRPKEQALTDKLLGKWKFIDIEVDEGDVSEEMPVLQYQLHATARKNLTLEFFLERNVFRRYQGENGDKKISGEFQISFINFGGDISLPYLRLFRDTGEPLSLFISGISKRGFSGDLGIVLAVTEELLYLNLSGATELTPNGWARSGGIRCSFKRIK